MTNPEPVEPYRPPPQWSRSDLEAAKAAGAWQRISAALDSGQLRDLLTADKPYEPRKYPRKSTPISDKDLPRLLAAEAARQEQQ